MNFEQALQYAREGKKIKLPDWDYAYITVKRDEPQVLVMYSTYGTDNFIEASFALYPLEIMSTEWDFYEPN